MKHVLAGDIGGTKTALSLYALEDNSELREVASARFASSEYSGLLPIVHEFLGTTTGGSVSSLRAAAFGVAGPVEHGISKTTNLPWVIDQRRLSEQLGAPVGLINDFYAVALGIGELRANELEVLQEGEVDPKGPVAIIGAGTGLGQALLVPSATGVIVLPSQGGHTDFAPRNELEIELLRFLWKRHRTVSNERVISGMGIKTLYEFITQTGHAPESPAVKAELEDADAGAVIGKHALAATDPACVRAIDMFISLYGAEAGNLALKTLPTGGLYVTGGIAPRQIEKLRHGSFMHAFLDKGRMASLLEKVRVSVVMNSQVGLLGARWLAKDLVTRQA
jgi:glucokinase